MATELSPEGRGFTQQAPSYLRSLTCTILPHGVHEGERKSGTGIGVGRRPAAHRLDKDRETKVYAKAADGCHSNDARGLTEANAVENGASRKPSSRRRKKASLRRASDRYPRRACATLVQQIPGNATTDDLEPP